MAAPGIDSTWISRRTFLKVGVAGAGVLIAARLLYTASHSIVPERDDGILDDHARSIVRAVAPALLAGALPATDASISLLDEIVRGVDQAVAGLPPATRHEVAQLFSLLAFAPTRCLLAGVWSPWANAPRDEVAAFLRRWRESSFALQQTAYGALHQLIFAAWYANPHAWPAIGYAGPPRLIEA